MRRFRSLLIDRANLRVPGLHVLSFALHRHLPEHASVAAHQHTWCQAIVYLNGAGEQIVGRATARVGPGSLVLMPPGIPHAFVRRSDRAPLCVMVDFRLHGARRRRPVIGTLNRSEVAELRAHVAHLLKLQAGAGEALRWEGAVPVLQVLLTVLRAAGWIDRLSSAHGRAASPAVGDLLANLPQTPSLAEVVRRSGYHRDHLNRLVKRETGLTLGQYRAQQRLALAKKLLGAGVQASHVGATIGLTDQSYFARWFRRQTGQTPTAWARSSA